MAAILGLKDKAASIRQCIRIILMTSPGEVPFRPRFGLGAGSLLDGAKKNVDIAYAVIGQLERYEKRIKVKKVDVASTATGQKTITINYTIIINQLSDILTIDL